ncbi:MAG: hypothetical protein BJ554DRAFT_4847, partial [Olpidium bornovanus]
MKRTPSYTTCAMCVTLSSFCPSVYIENATRWTHDVHNDVCHATFANAHNAWNVCNNVCNICNIRNRRLCKSWQICMFCEPAQNGESANPANLQIQESAEYRGKLWMT